MLSVRERRCTLAYPVYSPEETVKAVAVLKSLGTPCLIHQPKYSLFVREIENGLLDVLENNGVGCIPFSPLAQGLAQRQVSKRHTGGFPGCKAAWVPESR